MAVDPSVEYAACARLPMDGIESVCDPSGSRLGNVWTTGLADPQTIRQSGPQALRPSDPKTLRPSDPQARFGRDPEGSYPRAALGMAGSVLIHCVDWQRRATDRKREMLETTAQIVMVSLGCRKFDTKKFNNKSQLWPKCNETE